MCHAFVPKQQKGKIFSKKAIFAVVHIFLLNVFPKLNSFDYVKIIDDEGTVVGKFCGGQTGKILLLTGEFFSITFHSDYNREERGFHVTFTAVSFGT